MKLWQFDIGEDLSNFDDWIIVLIDNTWRII